MAGNGHLVAQAVSIFHTFCVAEFPLEDAGQTFRTDTGIAEATFLQCGGITVRVQYACSRYMIGV